MAKSPFKRAQRHAKHHGMKGLVSETKRPKDIFGRTLTKKGRVRRKAK